MAQETDSDNTPNGIRLDKWLWFSRIVKSRTLASTLVSSGKVRINRNRIDKPSQTLRAGDVVTVAVHRRVRVLKVLSCGTRRGPAAEAQTLYEDLTPAGTVPDKDAATRSASSTGNDAKTAATEAPANMSNAVPVGERDAGSGRPTKRDRRVMDRLRQSD